MDMDEIAGQIEYCQSCSLCENRTNAVPGSGNEDPDIVFVGEAPGKEEDKNGIPFVGDAGKILNKVLDKVGINRDNVFIGNILKCKPPANRNPTNEEIETCTPFLDKQIEALDPEIICCLGYFASDYILKRHGKKSGRMKDINTVLYKSKKEDGSDLYIMPLYHPASVIYEVRKGERVKYDLIKEGMKKVVDVISEKTEEVSDRKKKVSSIVDL